MEMIKRINRQSIYLIIGLAIIGAFIDYRRMPLGVIVGGLLALVNLRAIQWGVTALVNPSSAEGAKGKLLFFSMLRLLALFVILAILLYLKLVSPLGILLGLTAVFAIIIKEGMREARRQ